MERYFIARSRLRFDACVVCAAEYTCTPVMQLVDAILFPALRKVVEKHAALGIGIQGESTNHPTFVRLKNVDLNGVVEYSDVENLQAVMESQFLTSIPVTPNLPLWRLVVMKNNIVVFSWHHAIGDGMSSLAFHSSLLAALGDPCESSNQELPVNLVQIPTTTSLSPPVETFADIAPYWTKIIRELFYLFAPTSWTQGASAWTGNNVPGQSSLKTHVRILDFSASDITPFLDICRTHGATLTSSFHSIGVAALSSVLQKEPNIPNYKTISSFIPVSLRRFTGTPPDVFCVNVSTYHSYPLLNPSFSWSDAASLAALFRSGSREIRQETGLVKYIFGNYEGYFKGKLGQKRGGGLEFSNLGLFNPVARSAPGPDLTKWSIGNVTWAQSDAVAGSALKMNIVGMPTGDVTTTVTFGDGSVDVAFAEKFIREFRRIFHALLLNSDGSGEDVTKA